jgi:hypothetical protein
VGHGRVTHSAVPLKAETNSSRNGVSKQIITAKRNSLTGFLNTIKVRMTSKTSLQPSLLSDPDSTSSFEKFLVLKFFSGESYV